MHLTFALPESGSKEAYGGTHLKVECTSMPTSFDINVHSSSKTQPGIFGYSIPALWAPIKPEDTRCTLLEGSQPVESSQERCIGEHIILETEHDADALLVSLGKMDPRMEWERLGREQPVALVHVAETNQHPDLAALKGAVRRQRRR